MYRKYLQTNIKTTCNTCGFWWNIVFAYDFIQWEPETSANWCQTFEEHISFKFGYTYPQMMYKWSKQVFQKAVMRQKLPRNGRSPLRDRRCLAMFKSSILSALSGWSHRIFIIGASDSHYIVIATFSCCISQRGPPNIWLPVDTLPYATPKCTELYWYLVGKYLCYLIVYLDVIQSPIFILLLFPQKSENVSFRVFIF